VQNFIKNIILGSRRILYAFKYSYDGFRAIFKSEPAFRQDVVIFIIFSFAALMLDVSKQSRALMLFSLFFILFAEAVNTAVEVCIDRISPEIHPLSKKAKDIGSLLVLLSFVNAIVIWWVVLF